MTVANPKYADMRWCPDDNKWVEAKKVIGDTRVLAGPQLSQQLLHAPEHLGMVIARYRAAAALIGNAQRVLEIGCGEGIGAGILAKGRSRYYGIDTDADALAVTPSVERSEFARIDILNPRPMLLDRNLDAVVSLDVIEHIPASLEETFMDGVLLSMMGRGVAVIGTPNAAFDHLASPQSKVGHINTYTHERLHALMSRYFHVVQSFGMQDTALHLGHPDARHYLLMAGIGPKRS